MASGEDKDTESCEVPETATSIHRFDWNTSQCILMVGLAFAYTIGMCGGIAGEKSVAIFSLILACFIILLAVVAVMFQVSVFLFRIALNTIKRYKNK